jgi:hypothetical protein
MPADSPLLPPIEADEWQDLWWRLSHLYWILDRNGHPVLFKPNDEQRAFIKQLWYRNNILKARQLGFSTLMAILALDQCMWVPNFTAAVIDITMPDAIKKLRKVDFAYNRLPQIVKMASPVKSKAATEWMWENGSSLYCGVSARGGTTNLLHVSELGKIAARFPQKAREIITGAFESVSLDGMIVVESTAEGAAGPFFEITDAAHKAQLEKSQLTKLDFRLHFFPWYTSKDYTIDPTGVHIPESMKRYFRELQAKEGITLTPGQMAWYVAKRRSLKGDMKREYPSTVAEAFEANIEGAVYAEQMTWLRENGRICKVPLNPTLRVNTFWDLGGSDMTAIWFHQYDRLQHRFIRYREANNKGLRAWWKELEEWRLDAGFEWGRHFLPHDVDHTIQGEDITTQYSILHDCGMRNMVAVPRIHSIRAGYELTRAEMVGNVWFDKDECADGIKCLDAYQFIWNEARGVFTDEPAHNWASHGADALRQWAQSIHRVIGGDATPSIQRLKSRDRKRRH